MRALIQRVEKCSVYIDNKCVSSIGKGILIFLAVKRGDTEKDVEYLAKRCVQLRIFDDESGKMNLSVKDIEGDAMVVSQFTLYGDTRSGNRPSYTEAADPKYAEILYEKFLLELKRLMGNSKVSSGVFRAMMNVELINDGPVTLMIESKAT